MGTKAIFSIITESNLAIGPFETKEQAMEKAADFGLGEERSPDGDDTTSGWLLAAEPA